MRLNHAPCGITDLVVRCVTMPRQNDAVTVRLDLQFSGGIPAHLSKDGPIQDEARRVANTGDLLDERHSAVLFPGSHGSPIPMTLRRFELVAVN